MMFLSWQINLICNVNNKEVLQECGKLCILKHNGHKLRIPMNKLRSSMHLIHLMQMEKSLNIME